MPPNIIVIAVDRLGAGFLGPYGATWLDTPGLNALAGRSLLIEHVLSDSPELATVYRSFWTGRHALSPDMQTPSLQALLSDAGWSTSLVTDDQALSEHRLASRFGQRLVVPQDARREAASVEETQFAQVLAAAQSVLDEISPPFLLWVHAAGVQGAWDAPWELRAQFADEDDPEPPHFVEPPVRMLPKKHDPDELLGVIHAYAGQVAALDLCIESFLNVFFESELAESTLVAFTSPRGYPLGEHRRIGPVDDALYGELLRLPLLLRFPNGAAHRAQAITQPPDLFATLAEWAGVPIPPSDVWGRSLLPVASGDDWPRDRAVAVHGRQRAIRTPPWFLRLSHAAEEDEEDAIRRELFGKPDDQWEVNEVSDRAPEMAEEMAKLVENFEEAVAANDDAQLAPLENSS
ncbi:MAG: sulfatase-like hydrolase/transferase [Planctomycetes bacterium]|nr:sulfatase-like hydrolase/transferase [Planctomycetota bacterium]